MTNEQNAQHVEVLHSIIASGDWSEAERAAIRAAIAALSSPPAAGDADWVKWHGGPCPVPRDTRVAYRMRSPYGTHPESEFTDFASDLRWEHIADDDFSVSDIVAYRVLDAAPKPAAPPSVTDAMVDAARYAILGNPSLAGGGLTPAAMRLALEAALTHPGHKHAQEDAAQEATRGEPVAWTTETSLEMLRDPECGVGMMHSRRTVHICVPLYAIDSKAK